MHVDSESEDETNSSLCLSDRPAGAVHYSIETDLSHSFPAMLLPTRIDSGLKLPSGSLTSAKQRRIWTWLSATLSQCFESRERAPNPHPNVPPHSLACTNLPPSSKSSHSMTAALVCSGDLSMNQWLPGTLRTSQSARACSAWPHSLNPEPRPESPNKNLCQETAAEPRQSFSLIPLIIACVISPLPFATAGLKEI